MLNNILSRFVMKFRKSPLKAVNNYTDMWCLLVEFVAIDMYDEKTTSTLVKALINVSQNFKHFASSLVLKPILCSRSLHYDCNLYLGNLKYLPVDIRLGGIKHHKYEVSRSGNSNHLAPPPFSWNKSHTKEVRMMNFHS